MRFRLVVTVLAGALAAVPAAAQDMAGPPMPGPEHKILQMDAGSWDAVIEISGPPGEAPMSSKGVETNTVGCGGLCLISDFKGEFMPGTTFHGHGMTTYDPAKKKYVGSWTDSMSRGLMVSEGSYDPSTKTFTSSMEGPDMNGNIVTSRVESRYIDADHRTMTMFMTTPDGTEIETMKITYTRQP